MGGYNKWDHYNKKAKEKGFAARSVFKLEELDRKGKFFSKGDWVIDLGCAPGSWTQYVLSKVTPEGAVIGIDLEEVTVKNPRFFFHHGPMEEAPFPDLLQGRTHVDAVISDMAPKTSGIRFADQERSLELCREALQVAVQWLKEGGLFICKIFEGNDTKKFELELKKQFQHVARERPNAVRKESKEFYFVCSGLKRT